jgi:lipopolysaccharide heptosyltransferase II
VADKRPSRRRYDASLLIDDWAGPVLCALLLAWKRLLRSERGAPAPETVERILLLKMWGMGSIVLASPLLAKLRARYPKARIDFVSLRENESIIALYPEIDRVISIDLSRGVAAFLGETVVTLRKLRAERYDLLLDLEFFTRFSAIFSFLTHAGWSHGFSAKGKWRGRLHDAEVPFNAYSHVTQNFLTLLAGDAMSPIDPAEVGRSNALPLLTPPPDAWERCREKLRAASQWEEGRALVVVNPNAGDMALERRWPTDRFAELLVHVTAQLPVNVVVIGSPAERGRAEAVIQLAGLEQRVVNLAGKSDIGELVALLAHADVVVSNDSGPMHIAAAVGTSIVALFGPETPVLYGPLRSAPSQHHAVHYLGLRCSPCMFVHDNKVLSCWFSQAQCMTGIAVADVFASVQTLLAGEDSRSSGASLRVLDR